MRDPKEIYMEEHDRLVAEAMEAGMSESAAYETTADAAYAAMTERFADMVDQARERVLSEADERALRAAAVDEWNHDHPLAPGEIRTIEEQAERADYVNALVDSAR
jgi:hypothetical protein